MAVQNGILKQGSGITFISRCILRQENILPNLYLLVQSSNSTMETVGAIKAPEWHHWHRSGVFIIGFEQILRIALVFLMSILDK